MTTPKGTTACLISCSKSKADNPGPMLARYRYTSQLFAGALDWAEARFDRVGILSAKHGLVLPNQGIQPYDLSLRDLPKLQRGLWGEKVADQLHALWPGVTEWTVLAGAAYVEPLREAGVSFLNTPLHGLSQGERLRWFAWENAGLCGECALASRTCELHQEVGA